MMPKSTISTDKTDQLMKKMLLLVAALFAAMQLMAADIDIAAARSMAQQFMMGHVSETTLRSSTPAIMWVHQEANSSNVNQVAYYVVNTEGGFVIVAGDDRAQEILAYGDRPLDDMSSIPDNMRFWLDYYKQQMEYLQARPGMVVEKETKLRSTRIASVEPMLEAMWNQGDPYYGMCPFDGDRRSQTGCAATSLSQVFYKWKYPTDPTPSLPGYTTKTKGIVVEALPSITFDWENMLSTYTIFSPDASKLAVAQLMRYIGQAEEMDYTNEGSQAWEDDILRACKLFGYYDAHIVYKSFLNNEGVETVYLTDDEWDTIIQDELSAGRPVVFCGYHFSSAYNSFYGHAFNVDGYDANTGLYSINWGWSGTGNGYFALNAFSNQGQTYNIGQLIIAGIEPPAPLDASVMQPVDTTTVTLNSFTAQWTAVEGADTYTLEVFKAGSIEEPTGVYEKVFTETFPYCQSNDNSAITKPDNYCTNKGWTANNIYETKGGFRIGSSKTGYLTTPGVDMTQSGGKMTVKAVLKPYNTDTDVPITVSCGSSIVSLTISNESTYTIVLDCEETEGQKVTFATTTANKRVVITQLDIYSSVERPAMRLTNPVEEGDSVYRLITGIESTSYTVTGLLTDEYEFRVKAVGANGNESEWSNTEAVTLNGAAHDFAPGDVDHDGHLSVADVAKIIGYLINGGDICEICSDFNNDGNINLADMSQLIARLLVGE